MLDPNSPLTRRGGIREKRVGANPPRRAEDYFYIKIPMPLHQTSSATTYPAMLVKKPALNDRPGFMSWETANNARPKNSATLKKPTGKRPPS